MVEDLFGPNKRKVREMDTRLIDRCLGDRKGTLRYLGLPASPLTDVLLWKEYFAHISAIERGREPQPYLYQHDLILTAMRHRLASRLRLFRGDIDDVLKTGKDDCGSLLQYPYDVVSLDYSGGLIYKDNAGRAPRVDAIQALFAAQAALGYNFLLLLSFNLDNEDQGEIRRVIEDVGRELGKLGADVEASIEAHLKHDREEVRWKVYVPFLIRQSSSQWYRGEYSKPIFYEGNRSTRMMHFSVWLTRSAGSVAGRPSRQTLLHILNLPSFECVNGELHETNFDIPPTTTQ